MKAFVCEMCGSQELVKQDGMYVCQHCGTKYAPEEAKKLMVELSGSVEIDNSKKLENLYVLARRAKDEGNSEDGAKYYAQIALEAPNDWEAQFYKTYFECMQTKIAYMDSACVKLGNCLESVFSLIDQNIDDIEAKQDNYLKISSKCIDFVTMVMDNTTKHGKNYASSANQIEFMEKHTRGVVILLTKLGDELKKWGQKENTDKLLENALSSYKLAYSFSPLLEQNEKSVIIQRIQSLDPNFQVSTSSTQTTSSGCYVATCVYGSYDCPQVWTLRRYRDNTLAKTWYGRAFIKTYYAISPSLVKWFGHSRWFKRLWKPYLNHLVKKLRDEGVSDRPYQDRKW